MTPEERKRYEENNIRWANERIERIAARETAKTVFKRLRQSSPSKHISSKEKQRVF